jgi:ADP-heptose:LPS heptosyltransferase
VRTPHGTGCWDEWQQFLRTHRKPKILLIQRDNIGDLVLTTPFLRSLREALPGAMLDILSNSYNAPVLAGNGAIDQHYWYTKLKHRSKHQSALRVIVDNWKLRRQLRLRNYDLAIIPATLLSEHALRLARSCRPKRIAAFTSALDAAVNGVDLAIDPNRVDVHPVKAQRAMLEHLVPKEILEKLPAEPPPCEVTVDREMRAQIERRLEFKPDAKVVAFHVSARKIDQRWPAENFAALMRRVHVELGAQLLLLWAPGSSENPLHPGDDEKAEEISALISDLAFKSHSTATLGELIAVLSLADLVVLSDGGAMHLAAALQKPLVCMFGNSDPNVWRAWRTRQSVLRDSSNRVAALPVERVFAAIGPLLEPVQATLA